MQEGGGAGRGSGAGRRVVTGSEMRQEVRDRKGEETVNGHFLQEHEEAIRPQKRERSKRDEKWVWLVTSVPVYHTSRKYVLVISFVFINSSAKEI